MLLDYYKIHIQLLLLFLVDYIQYLPITMFITGISIIFLSIFFVSSILLYNSYLLIIYNEIKLGLNFDVKDHIKDKVIQLAYNNTIKHINLYLK